MHPTDPSPQPSPARGEGVRIGRPLRDARRSGGFTLTELLVVIAIIAMLVALTSVAVMRAMDTAKQTRMKSEVDQLDLGLKAYKEKYGSYPPCNLFDPTNNAALRQHVARAFPRYDLTYLFDDLKAAGVDTQFFRPDQALVFWLRGFSSDPAHPFVNTNDYQIVSGVASTTKVTRTQLFDFDVTRLASSDTLAMATRTGMNHGPVVPSYFPAGVSLTVDAPTLPEHGPFSVWSGGGAAYVYYDAASYGSPPTTAPQEAIPTMFNTTTTVVPFTDAGTAVPYWFDQNGNKSSAENTTPPLDFDTSGNPIENWANPDSFQIIATGGDGKYGAANVTPAPARLYPTGYGYDTSPGLLDDDNVTNFAANARLGDAKP